MNFHGGLRTKLQHLKCLQGTHSHSLKLWLPVWDAIFCTHVQLKIT